MQTPPLPVASLAPGTRLDQALIDEATAPTALARADVLQLFDSTAPALRRYVRSCGLTAEAAEDVVQDAFLALFRHLCAGGARHNLRGWLVQVSYRLALKQRERLARRRGREMPWEAHPPDALVDPTGDPEGQLADREYRGRLQAVFRALPEKQQQCVTLRADGWRYRDIARALGMSLGGVAKALTYAIRRLSNAVKE